MKKLSKVMLAAVVACFLGGANASAMSVVDAANAQQASYVQLDVAQELVDAVLAEEPPADLEEEEAAPAEEEAPSEEEAPAEEAATEE